MPNPLNIAVDVRDLKIAKTGTFTYLEELCKEFKKMQSDELHFHFMDTWIPVYTGNNKILKLIEHLNYQLWKQLVLPLKAFFKRCDIVFCTDNVVPILHLGYQTISVFHDAFFFEMPENYSKLWLWLYKNTALPAANRSAFVITPTAYAKKQINHYTGIPNEKLVVVFEGPKTLAGTYDNDNSLLRSFSLTPGNYLLHVGSVFKRKNIPALIYAFSKLKNQGYADLKLVLAGPTPQFHYHSDYQLILDAINDTKLKNDIILTGYLTDASLAYIYKNALLYVFPSINEGFGIPVLEAFGYNLPVIVANNTCLPEVGGNAVLQFDPFDENDIYLKIKKVVDDVDLQKEMAAKGMERLKQFSWRKTALELITVFKKAANYS
ncbi:MAG TPA: glycosyltransferase family 1 protein [Mucilaginibacter sp.]|jgi:glycosyltransferase involved in cell wall biosynthesis|nr:glycosyltransferase family 1 protein [Mucilaginibacter sp.]